MVEIVTILIIILIVGLASLYIIKAKKSGQKCIGCPYAKTCSKKEKCSCSEQQY